MFQLFLSYVAASCSMLQFASVLFERFMLFGRGRAGDWRTEALWSGGRWGMLVARMGRCKGGRDGLQGELGAHGAPKG
jgi:hypothetical protein